MCIPKYHRLPISLDITNQAVLLVGGGRLASRRLHTLLETGAIVTIISPTISSSIRSILRLCDFEDTSSDHNKLLRVRWEEKCYESTDVVQIRPVLIFTATDDTDVNRQVREDAKELGIWVNDGSDGKEGSFILPSIINRGTLQLTVSTGGVSPAFAAKMRAQLESDYGPEYEEVLDFLAQMRMLIRRDIDNREERVRLNQTLANLPLLEMCHAGRFEAWCEQVLKSWEQDKSLPWSLIGKEEER